MIAKGWLVIVPVLLCSSACEALFSKLPDESPPLKKMVEPLELFEEPGDEEERLALPYGGFTGVVVAAGWQSLDDDGESGVVVTKVVENSPGDVGGLVVGDVLIAAYDARGKEYLFSWPSQWRKIELEARQDDVVKVVYDRAGVEMETSIKIMPRVRPPGRAAAERFREESRLGVVFRTATEVEAREVGLAPGGGAVIVGLSQASPWRLSGLIYEDLIVTAGGRPVDHPQMILNLVREGGDEMEIEYVRNGERKKLIAPLSHRERDVSNFHIPLLFIYDRDRDETSLSMLFWIFHYRATPVASEWRFLWFFWLRSGDADRLEEVSAP